jgi:hypothetical protein
MIGSHLNTREWQPRESTWTGTSGKQHFTGQPPGRTGSEPIAPSSVKLPGLMT